MKQLADLYYSYKMEAASKFNIMLDVPNISNLDIFTPLKPYFNEGKTYLHTPINVNMWLSTIATINYIIKAKYIIFPCLVVTFLPLIDIFISPLDRLKKSLLSKLFWLSLVEKIVNHINRNYHNMILTMLKGMIKSFKEKLGIHQNIS